jgi:phosphatidylserine decarboxylase
MNYPHPIIAREGWPFIAIAAVIALLIHAIAGFGFAWPFWLLSLSCSSSSAIRSARFRRAERGPGPADGRIVAVGNRRIRMRTAKR